MTKRVSLWAVVSICLPLLATACGGADPTDDGSVDSLTGAKKHKCKTDADCKTGQIRQAGYCAAGGPPPPPPPGPVPNPPPASCDQRHSGVTGIQVLVQVTKYHGLIHGKNGDHEIADATVISIPWVYQASLVDTHSVQLAMNVHSSIDPSGLPHEVPLTAGEQLEVEGEWIPAATANAGGEAVLHYTHSPCGYAVINGTKYQ